MRMFVQPVVPAGHSASADSEPTVEAATVSLPPVGGDDRGRRRRVTGQRDCGHGAGDGDDGRDE